MAFTMVLFVKMAGYMSSAATCFAIVVNTELMYLIRTASPEEFGNYPKLIFANSLNLIMFSLIHAFIQPIISIEKTVVYVFAAKNYLSLPKIAMRFLMAAYGATYCMSLVLCAVMFVYRYNRVCRRQSKWFDSTKKILLCYLLVIFIGFQWAMCIFFLAQETPAVDEIISSSLTNYYGMELPDVTYVAAAYEITVNGTVTYNYPSMCMGGFFLTVISSSVLITGLCVYKISTQCEILHESFQKQLFRAQCVQFIIPLCLVCMPIFGVLLLPLLHLNGNVIFSIVSVLVSIYPVLDPLSIILFISHYRERVCGKQIELPY